MSIYDSNSGKQILDVEEKYLSEKRELETELATMVERAETLRLKHEVEIEIMKSQLSGLAGQAFDILTLCWTLCRGHIRARTYFEIRS